MPGTMSNLLPRWRGFNLLDMFTTKSTGPFREEDFQMISEWGFDFVRLPLCYTLWTNHDDPYQIREDRLVMIDQAVEFGRRYGIHVNINFHRAPGYSVNAERKEPFDVWKDESALKACIFRWQLFARRYAGISSKEISFNLFNEPMTPKTDPAEGMTRADHERVLGDAYAVAFHGRDIIDRGHRSGQPPPSRGQASVTVTSSRRRRIAMAMPSGTTA